MAQAVLRCGQKILHRELQQQNPDFERWLSTEKQQRAANAIEGKSIEGILMKTSAASPIPVIFHVIVDTNQYIQLGSDAGIAERVRSQLQSLNADYNGLNSDRSKTPSVWVPVLGSPDISFAAAHVDPAGNYTPGYEVKIVPNGTSFSALNAAKTAKFAASGGTDAWDPKRYLNIWVANISYSSSTILGITAPPAYAGFTEPEYGVALNYKVFGARTSPGQYFLTPFDHGRTLTHEVGHFFYIWHPSGDDDGTCDGDDGLSDTPPEADNCTGSPSFPRFDICSPDGNGIMFMNFMDYTNDTALYMFTKQQAAVMQSEVGVGGRSHSLTLNPHLSDTQLSPPDRVTIGPNPSNGFIYLFYNPAKVSIQSLSVWNIMGQKLIESTEPGIASIDLSALSKGVYFVRCTYNNQVTQEKIILQ
jgi:hypothetical protein